MMAKLPNRLATRTEETAAPIAWLMVVAAMLADTKTPEMQIGAISRREGDTVTIIGRWGTRQQVSEEVSDQ